MTSFIYYSPFYGEILPVPETTNITAPVKLYGENHITKRRTFMRTARNGSFLQIGQNFD